MVDGVVEMDLIIKDFLKMNCGFPDEYDDVRNDTIGVNNWMGRTTRRLESVMECHLDGD